MAWIKLRTNSWNDYPGVWRPLIRAWRSPRGHRGVLGKAGVRVRADMQALWVFLPQRKEATAKWTLTKNIFWESHSRVLSSLGLSCHFSSPRNPFFTFLLLNLNSFIFLPVFFFFLLLFIDSIFTLAPASTLCCFTTLENKEWKRIYKVLEK